MNAFLCCSFLSIPMPAIYLCRAIRLRHDLRLSDCSTSFTELILLLPLLLMVHGRTLSAILYSTAAAGNLMCASSSSSTYQSSDFNFLASIDAWLVAHLLFLQLLWDHLLVLTCRGGRLWPSTREEFGKTNSLILLASSLLFLLDVASRKHRRTHFLLFTFVFKYSPRKVHVKAHAFYA